MDTELLALCFAASAVSSLFSLGLGYWRGRLTVEDERLRMEAARSKYEQWLADYSDFARAERTLGGDE